MTSVSTLWLDNSDVIGTKWAYTLWLEVSSGTKCGTKCGYTLWFDSEVIETKRRFAFSLFLFLATRSGQVIVLRMRNRGCPILRGQ